MSMFSGASFPIGAFLKAVFALAIVGALIMLTMMGAAAVWLIQHII